MTKNEIDRFAMRETVLADKTLSPGARFFYIVLDHLSGFKGESWHKQANLATVYGVSQRTIRYWLTELEPYVETIKQPRTAIYKLRWVASVRQPVAAQRGPVRQYIAALSGNPLPVASLYMNQESEPSSFACEKCEDLGVLPDGLSCTCSKGKEVLARRIHPRRRA